MPSKRLMGAWAFFDFCLLAAGAVTVGLSIAWRAPDLLKNLVISNEDLTGMSSKFESLSLHKSDHIIAGLVLGVALLVSWVISIGAVVQPIHVTVGLVLFNWALIVDALAVIVIGTIVWFYTLQERANYHAVYSAVSAQTRLAIQDKVCRCANHVMCHM